MHRRRFLTQSAVSAAGLLSLSLPSWAKAFAQGPLHNIPVDKKLAPSWIKSLYSRGLPTTYLKSRNELKYIGMPAGGLHAGTVYLGGDGRLWLWGVYNDTREGIDPKTVLWNDGVSEKKIRNRDGASYVEPAIAANKRVLEQGFGLLMETDKTTVFKELKEEDWDEVTFEATYPVATIRYKSTLAEVTVKAGGLFIPLDADNSATPATIFDISVKNLSPRNMTATITGWLENGARKISGQDGEGLKQNIAIEAGTYSSVYGDFQYKTQPAELKADDGSTCITLLAGGGTVNTEATPWSLDHKDLLKAKTTPSTVAASEKLVGAITTKPYTLKPGATTNARFALSWHFNHLLPQLKTKLKDTGNGHFYGAKFANAAEAGKHIAIHPQLWEQTLRWKDTFYDSTLPHWFLERTFLNIGTLATANTYRFASGRFWSWEGVNACEGTCTHVWQYAQTMARIFPSLERDCRQRTDLGIGMEENGGIIFRAEFETRPAIDGQAGSILRMYREHQMSANNDFLQHNWENTKKAVRFMLAQDKNGDGLTDTPMENTLDAVWEGEIAWIAGLCIAAAKAAQLMAEEMNDTSFAAICKDYVEKGSRNMDQLFNGEYFIHRPDAVQGRKKLGSYNTCHIDQVYGQSWAWQVGLGRLWDKEKTLSALRALWKYNFTEDVGPYIKTHIGGRPYAVAGEGGMILNTNPHNEPRPFGQDVTWQLGYFHECMSGFEHQVASHMMAEGMTDEALALTRCIHDRHHAAKRNPFNEIECSDHYARAMASYGTFITACGFEYHGPKGHIAFAPKWKNAEGFKAPFTAAEGWGTYASDGNGAHKLKLRYGSLQLNSISLVAAKGTKATVKLGDQLIKASVTREEGGLKLSFAAPVTIKENKSLKISIA
ncbi:GH116 family glycosyl hydrolase [uncultured Chitinophaga sp.]|uniref:GH116 family glycosyl hydrolase n=1 Tax=uncultured Chitinophaga sp. TaxID=339340 RepID=UPI0025F238CE|nr:GH116 family glycosyl hydrolase [uncultured Chitinophaga sp.]